MYISKTESTINATSKFQASFTDSLCTQQHKLRNPLSDAFNIQNPFLAPITYLNKTVVSYGPAGGPGRPAGPGGPGGPGGPIAKTIKR